MKPFLESLYSHRQAERALLAANFYNAETLMGIIAAAKQQNAEIILQTSPSTLKYLGVSLAASMARAAAYEAGVKAWLHLDHASDRGLIQECISAGYDSVMIDASESSLEENIKHTREVVKMAHAHGGVAVEAELGIVPKLGETPPDAECYTSVEEAVYFVKETGVDLLAVAVGTAHGFYRKKPALALDRLEAIRRVIDIPLVLHGGSGLSMTDWQNCIRRGIVKINFATEIKDTFTRSLQATLRETEDIDLRRTFQPAIESVTRLVAQKIHICSPQI